MRTRTSAALLLALTFLLGTVTGAVLHYLYIGHSTPAAGRPERREPRDLVEDMSRALGLDNAQKEKLSVIISQTRDRYRELSKGFRPQYDAIRTRAGWRSGRSCARPEGPLRGSHQERNGIEAPLPPAAAFHSAPPKDAPTEGLSRNG